MKHRAKVIEHFGKTKLLPSYLPYKLQIKCNCGFDKVIYGNERIKANRMRDRHNRKEYGD